MADIEAYCQARSSLRSKDTTNTSITTEKIMARTSIVKGLALAGFIQLASTPLQAAPVALSGDLSCTGTCGTTAATGDIGLSPLGTAQYGYVTTAGSTEYGVSPLTLDPNSRGGGTETNGSRVRTANFTAAQGDTLSVYFNFVSTDGKGYDDYAWARVLSAGTGNLVAWLFTASSTNSSTGKIIPGDVVDKNDFNPDVRLKNFKDFSFTSKTVDDPVDWAPLGGSNGSCWEDNAAGCGYTGWLLSEYAFEAAGQFLIEIGVTNWGDEAYDTGLAFDFQTRINRLTGLTTLAANSNAVPEPATSGLLLLGGGLIGLLGRRQRDGKSSKLSN